MTDVLKMAVMNHLRTYDPETLSVAQVVNLVIDTYDSLREAEHRDGFTPEGMNPKVRVRATKETKSWTRLTVRTVAVSGGPHRDTVDTYEVTFDGGHPSNQPGYELPFGVPRKFNPDFYKSMKSYPEKTLEQREADHYALIKSRLKGMLPSLGWQADKTAGEVPSMGTSVLERFEFVGSTTFTSTFRLSIRKPYMD